jgi:hypothetical protein
MRPAKARALAEKCDARLGEIDARRKETAPAGISLAEEEHARKTALEKAERPQNWKRSWPRCRRSAEDTTR